MKPHDLNFSLNNEKVVRILLQLTSHYQNLYFIFLAKKEFYILAENNQKKDATNIFFREHKKLELLQIKGFI
jgi:hypothetical protein